jgi:multidrug efflux pump subunit AcrA (membrane-fusion protein)
MKKVWTALVILALVAGAAAGVNWGVQNFLKTVEEDNKPTVPTTTVRRGRVTITVTSKGELQGGNSELLVVPTTGVGDVAITHLRPTGDIVQAGDAVIEFDTTLQEYNLREADADLAETQQRVLQAEAEAKAALEEARWTTVNADAQVKLAELEVRKNPLLAANVARQNDISLEAARNRKAQAERDFKNRQTTADAAITMQKANEQRSKLLMETAQTNISNMVLKAKTGGYVHVLGNGNGQLYYDGAVIPDFQVGDMVRTGQTIAQIPDMSTWEVRANIPELDRGYLDVGQVVEVQPTVLAGRALKGRVKAIGGTSGYGAYRRFDCRISLDEKHPALRPGMSVYVTITVAAMDNVLWLPSQALFEENNRAYVYLKGPQGFVQKDVTRVRKGESQTVIEGLPEGTEIALSRPDREPSEGKGDNSVLKAIAK